MEMNFPHPRRDAEAGLRKADYASLVASATAVQATSRTVRALLGAPRERVGENDALESRIAFFAKRNGKAPNRAHGAFFPAYKNGLAASTAKSETCVNLSSSTNRKDVGLGIVQPELQVAERGTEF
jgi:hypothetical protein